MTHVGEAIASSAAAVIVGLGGMAFAHFGLFNTTGPAVAVSVAVTLLAALTLTPAMLRLLGPRAFWPARAEAAAPLPLLGAARPPGHPPPDGRDRRVLVLLLPLNLAVLKTGQNFNFLGDLSTTVEAHAGFNTVEAHFGAGNALPGTLVIQSAKHAAHRRVGCPASIALNARLAALPGMRAVQGPTRPAGQPIAYQAYARSPQIQAALARNLSAGRARWRSTRSPAVPTPTAQRRRS